MGREVGQPQYKPGVSGGSKLYWATAQTENAGNDPETRVETRSEEIVDRSAKMALNWQDAETSELLLGHGKKEISVQVSGTFRDTV